MSTEGAAAAPPHAPDRAPPPADSDDEAPPRLAPRTEEEPPAGGAAQAEGGQAAAAEAAAAPAEDDDADSNDWNSVPDLVSADESDHDSDGEWLGWGGGAALAAQPAGAHPLLQPGQLHLAPGLLWGLGGVQHGGGMLHVLWADEMLHALLPRRGSRGNGAGG